jgi:hypothetical protein
MCNLTQKNLMASSYMKWCPKKLQKTVTCICPIVKNLRAHNSKTIGVMMMKRELDVYLNTEKPHKKFQVPM